MTETQSLKQTMETVNQAFDILSQFHQNVADLLRLIAHGLEDGEHSYTPLLHGGTCWTSSIEPVLRKASSWQWKHFALPFQCADEPEAPILLVNISIDQSFNALPEIWLGSFSDLESDEDSFPFTESTEYIFNDYFGPEETWNEPHRWYEERLEEDGLAATFGFQRLPMHSLTDKQAVQTTVCDVLQTRVDTLMTTPQE